MIVLIWIDWYPYHHARLRALLNNSRIGALARGIELVGKTGVHKGLVFRQAADPSLPLTTLMPNADWSLRTQVRCALLLWKELNRVNPTVLFIPGYYTIPAFAAALWGLLKNRRNVLMTESTQHDHVRTAWKENLKGLIMRTLFDYAIAGGRAHVRYLRALGFPKDRIARCYDVVDNAFYASHARKVRLKRGVVGSPYFLYAGRLAPEKNVACLIKAFADYRLAGGTWELVLVGGGPEESALKLQARDSGVGAHIQFAGLKDAEQLAAYYADASCFVLPSTREPWGLVVNEAAAAGLPLIISNRCGCAEDLIVEGENGFLFNPAKPEELTARMISMERAGPEQRARMGERSERLVALVSPQTWADEVARISSTELEHDAQLTIAASR